MTTQRYLHTGNNSVNIATNSVRRLIVDGNGYVTINNIPTAASATDILVSNGGVVRHKDGSVVGDSSYNAGGINKNR